MVIYFTTNESDIQITVQYGNIIELNNVNKSNFYKVQ